MTNTPTPYLLDTNTYAEFFKPANLRNPNFGSLKELITIQADVPIQSFYIAAVTSMEIHSAIGKYTRGSTGGKEICNHLVINSQNEKTKCGLTWESPTVKAFSKTKIALYMDMIDDAEKQRGSLQANILPPTEEAFEEAAKLLRKYAYEYALGSHDALIAGFLIAANKAGNNLSLVTFDKKFNNILKLAQIPFKDLKTS
jgi:hypothetical protein